VREKLPVDIAGTDARYDYIINCIGKPDLEYCESNPNASYVSNYSVVADSIRRFPKSKVIHFSSYYVYDDVGECNESSNTTQKYKYCKHKLMSEKVVVDHGGIVFRIGKIFGHSAGKKQNKLTEHLLFSDEVVLDDVEFNPVSLGQILRTLEHEIMRGGLEGVYNLANDGKVSHYEYGRFIKKHYNQNLRIKKIPKHERAFHNYGRFLMSCNKIKKIVPLLKWEKDMIQYLEEMKCIA